MELSVPFEFVGNDMSNDALSGRTASTGGKILAMNVWDQYRVKAAELIALASDQKYTSLAAEFEHLARAYLRLADQAERNSQLDIAYETPPPKPDDDQQPKR
jgi:hypothetical protein